MNVDRRSRRAHPRFRVPSRSNGAGTVFIVLDKVGDQRLPNYQNLDFHVERPVRVMNLRFVPSVDVFNLRIPTRFRRSAGPRTPGLPRAPATRIRSRPSSPPESSVSACA